MTARQRTPAPRFSTAMLAAAALCAALAPAGCESRSSAPSGSPGKIAVVVSILPQAYFVERIGGPRVAVDVLIPPGQSHHVFEPTPRQVARLAEAQAFFRIGVAFENALIDKVAARNARLRVVDTRAGIPLRAMTADEAHAHAGEPREATGDAEAREPEGHDRGADDPGPETDYHDRAAEVAGVPDPHIWLDPLLAKIQAQTICDELCRIDPAGEELYRANLAALHRDLDALHERIAGALAPFQGQEFLVYHPAYGYFADRYGLKQVAVEIEGKEPTPKALAVLIEKVKARGVRIVFVQPQFSKKGAEAVAAAIGGAVVTLDPLPRDYIRDLTDLAEKIEAAFDRRP